MPISPTDDPAPGRFEHQLRRSAARSAVEVVDPDLRRILSYVSRRRGRRTTPTGPTRTGAPALEGQVLDVEVVGPNIRILRIGRPPGLGFRPGQHIRLGLPGNRRAKFSIASAPHEDHVELCIQLVAGGRLTPALFALRPGDAVALADTAKGAFTLQTGPRAHLMVATGTGIAPFRSMIRDARHRGTPDRFLVLHGASHLDELPYRDELAGGQGVDYRPTITRPAEMRNRGWNGLTGRVDELAAVVASTLDPSDTHVYACGNGGMVEAVSQRLGAGGFAVAREVYD